MLKINYSDAKSLLALICEDTLVSFQTFDDGPDKQSKLAKIYHGLTDTNLEVLAELNQKGAGIFFTLNETDGKGRRKENIIGDVRTLVIDHDDVENIHRLDYEGSIWPPHAVIESSPGKFHSYFKVSGILLEKFSELQTALAAAWYGDQSIKDLPRVMRLPGFYHQKAEPFLTSIVSINPQQRAYTESDIRKIIATGPCYAASNSAMAERVKKDAHIRKGSRNNTLFKTTCSLFAKELSHEAIWAALMAENEAKCSEALPEAELRQLFNSARDYRQRDLENRDSGDEFLQNGHNPLIKFVLPLTELLGLEVPERENIIAPFLPAQSIAMVFAPRGLGKSWFCMELALCVAEGRQFMAWEVPKARRVLYIDGEMPQRTLIDRFKALSSGILDTLDILPSERLWKEDHPINLNNLADQNRIITVLENLSQQGRNPELIIFDNLSSMTAGSDENSNSEIDSLLRFQICLRHKGYATLFVHHAGKNGEQRGASRREDLLDTSIKLSAPQGSDSKSNGAMFTIEFVKTRGERPNPDKLKAQLAPDQYGGIEWVVDRKKGISAATKLLIAIYEHKPKTQNELASILGITQATVSEQLKGLVKKELVVGGKKPYELTKAGQKIAEENNCLS